MTAILAPYKRALQLASIGDTAGAEKLFRSSYPAIVASSRQAPGTFGLPAWRLAIMQAAGPAGMGAAKTTLQVNYPQLFGAGWRKARKRHSKHRGR